MKHDERINRTGRFVNSSRAVNSGTLRVFHMKELKRSLKLEKGKWIAAGSAVEADAIVNALLDESRKAIVLFVVFTDKNRDPLTYLCAVARDLDLCSFDEFDVFLFGLDAQKKSWLGQQLGKFAGGAKSSGIGRPYSGVNSVVQELRDYGIQIEKMFLDEIDQAIKLIYVKHR